jgi:hypothetical protein
MPLAQVWTHYKIGKLNMWTLLCNNVHINFFNLQIWNEIMLELNGKPSGVTTFSTDFSLQNLVFLEFIWIFSSRNHFKIKYLSHLESKSYQVNSIKSSSSRSFQQHQRHIPIPPKNFSYDLILISAEKSFDIQELLRTSPDVMEPSPCAPPRQELSKDTTNTIWSIPGSHNYKTKQTTLLHK